MCLILSVLLFGPRLILVIWWLFDPVRWAASFDTVLFPILGFLFLPWTTVMYVLVLPQGIEGLDWLVITLALLADVGSLAGGALRGRGRMQGYQSPPPSGPMPPP
jgi:hypothetical protein